MKPETRQAPSPWGAFVLCAFLSSFALFGPLAGPAFGIGGNGWWEPAVRAFLPMCFFIVAVSISKMQKELSALRALLQEGKGGSQVAVEAQSQPYQFSLKQLMLVVAIIAVQMAFLAAIMNVYRQSQLVAPPPAVARPPVQAVVPLSLLPVDDPLKGPPAD
jgi:hypothetical protein